ncbi:MAG: hypothetical protein VX615_02905 [Planctomycetota bacterium]|nr:hypothetical protein [Planctomycetota bacterium]
MRVIVLFIAAVLALAFDSGFSGLFTLKSIGNVTPMAMPCIVVFVALFAPEITALITVLLLGVLVDLSPGYGHLTNGVYLIGPHALGYFITGLFIMKFRNIVFRRRILTIVVFAIGCVLITGAVEALVLIVRGFMPWTPPITSGGFGAFLKLIGTTIYTGIFAVPIGWCLLSTIGVWRFHSPTGRRATWR